MKGERDIHVRLRTAVIHEHTAKGRVVCKEERGTQDMMMRMSSGKQQHPAASAALYKQAAGKAQNTN